VSCVTIVEDEEMAKGSVSAVGGDNGKALGLNNAASSGFIKEGIMKRRTFFIFLVLILFGFHAFGTTADAAQRRKRLKRTVVAVHKGFPIRRAPRQVIIHPILRSYRVAPRVYLPLVAWGGVSTTVVVGSHLLVWEDRETLLLEEDWTEFTLNCENTGTKLWLEIRSGRVRFDWAEVVFENGETQVIEMQEHVRDPGFYLLLDFANGRMVDHIRAVAKAETPEARIVLKMQK